MSGRKTLIEPAPRGHLKKTDVVVSRSGMDYKVFHIKKSWMPDWIDVMLVHTTLHGKYGKIDVFSDETGKRFFNIQTNEEYPSASDAVFGAIAYLWRDSTRSASEKRYVKKSLRIIRRQAAKKVEHEHEVFEYLGRGQ
jgi:hypothetical protein